MGLAFADIGRPEQNAPRQVRELDIVAVNNSNIPNTEKGEILQDLIAQCPRTDDKDLGALQPVLFPPRYEAEPAIAILFEVFGIDTHSELRTWQTACSVSDNPP